MQKVSPRAITTKSNEENKMRLESTLLDTKQKNSKEATIKTVSVDRERETTEPEIDNKNINDLVNTSCNQSFVDD